MKEQEKQIEEMRIQRKLETTKDISNGISGVLAYEIQKLAEHLISLNYVKLPKDSVVLSREEYERLKHYEWRVTSGVCMTQKEWFDFCNEDSNRRTCLRIEERERERKETAEKIIEHILRFANEKGVVEMPIANIKSLAILCGVEIKE